MESREETAAPCVSSLKGVGPKRAAAMARLGIQTTADLLRHYPCRIERYPELQRVASLEEGCVASVRAALKAPLKILRRGSFSMTGGLLSDESGEIEVRWYHMPYLKKTLLPGRTRIFCGKVARRGGRLCLEQPSLFREADYADLQARPVPVYALTEGLSNQTLRRAIRQAAEETPFQEDWLPGELRRRFGLMEEDAAVRALHLPESMEQFQEARKRVVFDEFYDFLLGARRLKKSSLAAASAFPLDCASALREVETFLPFRLTSSQRKVCGEIFSDLSSGRVMNRLLQGDVGSGKTAVAAAALYAAFRSGFQGAVMVPTEVLAAQHFKTMERLFRDAPRRPRLLLLTGSLKSSEKKTAREAAGRHDADIVIGTHALIQEDVLFHRLALVVTDEQHRFGVLQRGALSAKGERPHTLVMSATPIPRTLAVILYGDQDVSVIDARPGGRKPVKNAVIGRQERPRALLHIKKEIEKGHQAYVICPLVEKSELTEAENVMDYSEALRESFRGIATIGCLHGRMGEAEKQRVMEDFAARRIDILVATTVVEVGVDVPGATVMMIENAERYGLASLHQLRGRVGRGEAQSYCIFVRGRESRLGNRRLEIVSRSNDGFEIAAEDLKMRGPGELFGSEQSGELTFGLGDIYNDYSVLQTARDVLDLWERPESAGTRRRSVIL